MYRIPDKHFWMWTFHKRPNPREGKMDDPLKITALNQPKQTIDYERDTFITTSLNPARSCLQEYRTFFPGKFFPSSSRSEYLPGSMTESPGKRNVHIKTRFRSPLFIPPYPITKLSLCVHRAVTKR